MFTDAFDTPFLPHPLDEINELQQIYSQDESDCPFGRSEFFVPDIVPTPDKVSEASDLKPIESEEDSCHVSQNADIPKLNPNMLISEAFEVEENVIVHRLSGTYIHDSSIDVLSLSKRSHNGLRRGEIRTIVQLARLTIPELQNIRNLGKNSVNEIMRVLNEFLLECVEKENSQKGLTKHENHGTSESTEEITILSRDREIDDTVLSVRAKNCLFRNGIYFLSELLKVSDDELSEFKNLGAKTLQEILDFKEKIQDELLVLQGYDEKNFSPEIIGFLDRFLEEVRVIDIENKFLRSILLARLDDECNTIEQCYVRWWKTECVLNKLRIYTSSFVKDHIMFGVNELQIHEHLPSSVSKDLLSELLSDMIKNNQIVQNGELYYPKTYAALDVLRENVEERCFEIFEMRMNHFTLEEIAECYDLTRERVRQLQNKALRILQRERNTQDIILSEERFRILYETYQLSEDEFTALTNTDKQTYGYLQLVCKSGTVDSEMIVHDESLPQWMRSKWIRYIQESASAKYIYLPEENHRRIGKTRVDIENYILSEYCQNEVSFDEFVKLYNDFIYKHHLENQNDLLLTNSKLSTRVNSLSTREFVLWKWGKRLRYYNIPANDYTELLQTLDLSQYYNTEISTLKLFKDNPELMRQYDLHDEYELHDLLKKIGVESENPTIKFERTPSIRFGEYDRDKMVKERLFELAPISANDFADILSEEYGFTTTQTMFWLECISEYRRNGVLTVDSEPMSDEHMSLLKSYLTDDFYFFSEVKAIYQKLFPNADVNLISYFNLKRMGFVVNSTYIIQHYDSAAKLFEHLLTQNDVQDISQLSKKYGNIMCYLSKLADLKGEYEIIEFLPYQYIHIRKLQKMKIEKEKLREYCDEVYSFADADTYFTVEYLQMQGFSSQLDSLGFEAWFYSSLLREDPRFSYKKLGGTVLFYKGSQAVSVLTFLRMLMRKYNMIEMNDLLEKVYSEYHIILNKDRLKWSIRNTEIYYDEIMEKLYQNYDMYFEELESIEEDDWIKSEEI